MEKKKAITLFILSLGTFMGALDSTIVILAFPSIADGLHSSIESTIWIILIYLLILSVTSIPFGRIGDIYGRSRMFNAGFVIFTAGSALCGLSGNIALLVLFRGIQAVGGSLLQANSGAIISDTFERNERGKAFGYNSLGFTIGAMVGIVLGGVIATYLGWQYIFYLNIPVGALAIALGILYIKDEARQKVGIDVKGIALLTLLLTLLSFGAVDYAGQGLTAYNLLLVIAGAALFPVFVILERREKNPMIDLASFRDSVLRNSILSAFFLAMGYFSVVFLITMYLQGIRGLSPLDASLLLIPGYVVGSFLSPIMGRQSDKYGAKIISTGGVAVMGVAILVYLFLKADSSLYIVSVASAIAGVGTSLFFPANSSAVMARARPGSYGSTSGILRMMQNIGILGSFVVGITIASSSIPRSVAFQIFLGTSSLSGDLSSVFIAGIDSALWVSMLFMLVAGVLSYSRGKETRS